MRTNKIIKLAKTGILATLLSAPVINAEVVFVDEFDQVGVTSVSNTITDSMWVKSQYTNPSQYLTSADVGDGVLSVTSNALPYGGVISKTMPEFNFFEREITITFRGLNIQALSEESRLDYQGVQIAVGSFAAGSAHSWHSYSHFSAKYFGNGFFNFSGKNAGTKKLVTVPLQSIPTPYLNFPTTDLTAVKLTLDDLNYRLLFEFGNPLNVLSFAGPHYLSEDLWHVSNTMRLLAVNRDKAEADLDAANATGDSVLIADAEAVYATVLADYQLQYDIEKPDMGLTSIFFGLSSEDRKGGIVTVDSITVETTSVLQALR